MRELGESYSDVILRLVEIKAQTHASPPPPVQLDTRASGPWDDPVRLGRKPFAMEHQ